MKKQERVTKILFILYLAGFLVLVAGVVIFFYVNTEGKEFLRARRLRDAQVVFIKQEEITMNGEKKIMLNCLDVEGDMHYWSVPYDKWCGLEESWKYAEAAGYTAAYQYDKGIQDNYDTLVTIDANAEYRQIAFAGHDGRDEYVYYGVRYRRDGGIECIKLGEESDSRGDFMLQDDGVEWLCNYISVYM